MKSLLIGVFFGLLLIGVEPSIGAEQSDDVEQSAIEQTIIIEKAELSIYSRADGEDFYVSKNGFLNEELRGSIHLYTESEGELSIPVKVKVKGALALGLFGPGLRVFNGDHSLANYRIRGLNGKTLGSLFRSFGGPKLAVGFLSNIEVATLMSSSKIFMTQLELNGGVHVQGGLTYMSIEPNFSRWESMGLDDESLEIKFKVKGLCSKFLSLATVLTK